MYRKSERSKLCKRKILKKQIKKQYSKKKFEKQKKLKIENKKSKVNPWLRPVRKPSTSEL